MSTYTIVRKYFEGNPRIIVRGVSLEEAQEHCNDPETSSSTAKNPSEPGTWFDCYVEE